ncbi:MAG: 50S ribosomal protein L22 [Sphingobacteriales bacterium]|jgi:large subunit ribosomal protein L22|nr:MAG: 50S ribosomal protein L22 [Sphingobacteriales bacterium]
MGARKKISAELRKEAKKSTCVAKATAVPTSPRKMRLVTDLVRGKNVDQALNILMFSSKHASQTVEKLLRSAIANWEQKNNTTAAEADLYVQEIFVDGGRVLKRFLPAPMGRAYRVRKRSNHLTLKLASRNSNNSIEVSENTDNN